MAGRMMLASAYAPRGAIPAPAAPASAAQTFAPLASTLAYNPNIGTANTQQLQMQAQKMAMEGAAKSGQRSQIGSTLGTLVGGPIGGLIGGALGGMIGSNKGKERVFNIAAGLGLNPSNPAAMDLAGFMQGLGKPAISGRVMGGGSRNAALQRQFDAAHAQSYQEALNRYNQYESAYGGNFAQGFGPQFGGGGAAPTPPGAMFAGMAPAVPMAAPMFNQPAQTPYVGLGWGQSSSNPFAALAATLRTKPRAAG
jgi:hypothetical protein